MPKSIFLAIALYMLAGLVVAPGAAREQPPRVMVSILPVHAIVAGVMAGVGTPELIIRGAGSPHSYALRPSTARLIEAADLVFWIGNTLETFLAKPLAALGTKAVLVTLLDTPGLAPLRTRLGDDWDEPPSHDDGSETTDRNFDPHIWLNPENAKAIARIAAAKLGTIDPARRATYAANADRVIARIDALDAELTTTLAPMTQTPFAVFHDAYQYFERRYGLNAVGAVTLGPERAPGAKRLRDIREKIAAAGVRCLFSEPQFGPALAATVIEGGSVRTAVLDPLGVDLEPGPDAYVTLMRRLADALTDCLAARD